MTEYNWQCLQKEPGLWLGGYEAMKSPCEIWLESDELQARKLIQWAAEETWRIEKKYSRFRADSVLSQINKNTGQWQTLDAETAALLHFAGECWSLTDGMIDITIGGYMQYWRFDGRTPPPPRKKLKQYAANVGWEKLQLKKNQLFLPQGMSLDLGGIGKEYAVDSIAMALATKLPAGGIMVNFGGDLAAIRAKSDGSPWIIGVENINHPQSPQQTIQLLQGAVATSGSSKRYAVDKRGKVLGHILNPKTGWPVAHGPASVTVVANTATQCGMLSTYAMLKGKQAASFLSQQQLQYFIQ
ncbi:MAG: FAD:protein FMN transferase [Gammaproteobacteria bacterium]